MTEAEFAPALELAAQALGITLPAGLPARCLQHVKLMLEWNRHTNLTRIVDLEDILARHVLDSLIPSRFLPPAGRGVDVGSGAGYPGVVLALALPELSMTLIESSRKKASFLKVLASHLRLRSLSVFHGTWQEWLETTVVRGDSPVDLITMRAVRLESAHLEDLAGKGLRPGGVFAFWAGSSGKSDSMTRDTPGLQRLEPIPYSLPSGGDRRFLLRWTPNR